MLDHAFSCAMPLVGAIPPEMGRRAEKGLCHSFTARREQTYPRNRMKMRQAEASTNATALLSLLPLGWGCPGAECAEQDCWRGILRRAVLSV